MVLLRNGSTGPLVIDLQRQLNLLGYGLNDDGAFGNNTELAVRDFQRKNHIDDDGVVGDGTRKLLPALTTDKAKLIESDYVWAATQLACDVPSVKAVREVEAPLGGFLQDGRVTILFERHQMYRQLKANGLDPEHYTSTNPDIVNKTAGGYLGKAGEYTRLAKAKQLHEVSALESCSWGAYQIMGYHWKRLGFKSVHEFLSKMESSERGQLECFVTFIKTDLNLLKAIRQHDWPTFARYYNGSNYRINKYDEKLEAAFKKYGGLK